MSKNTLSISLIAISICLMFVHQSLAQGNVTVEVRNGELRVTGENNSTQCLLVTSTGVPGQYEFSMPPFDNGAATLFNGETSLTVNGVTGDMRFDLKSGRKMLILSSELGIINPCCFTLLRRSAEPEDPQQWQQSGDSHFEPCAHGERNHGDLNQERQ